jgi:N-acetylmuramoyl-L-alanine amidase
MIVASCELECPATSREFCSRAREGVECHRLTAAATPTSRLAFGAASVFLHAMRLRGCLCLLAGFALGVISLNLTVRADNLSPLAPKPDWSSFDAYQKTISREEFARLVNSIYSTDGVFWNYCDINDDRVIVYSDLGKTRPLFTLHFASSESTCAPLPYHYKTQAISSDPSKPLKGIKIALDPGHIGGDWAKLEARWFQLGNDPPVMEAKLNLVTCERLAERLETDGATIIWAKHDFEPVTDLRPEDLHVQAFAALAQRKLTDEAFTPSFLFGMKTLHRKHETITEQRVNDEAALLFYRVAEIRARGDVVNRQHPDLTICVHYNADDWGNPDHPTLTGHSRLVIFINGAYEKSELAYDDYKFDMLRKLLDRTAVQEERGCALVGQSMLDTLKYPPEDYPATYFAHHVTDVPSVYARDLLANRIYHGPVIYCEGPYMNARDAYYRIIAGDYLGLRTIQGQSVPSIYREYAAAVEKGVLEYFGVK